jgi:hypothetical protein
VHLLYATLLAEDEDRDATFAELKINKKRLLRVAKRDVLTFQIGSASGTRAARARWNSVPDAASSESDTSIRYLVFILSQFAEVVRFRRVWMRLSEI